MQTSSRRGAFIVLEGLDRSGKSTQCQRLVTFLQGRGINAKGIRFPDRTTTIGKMIDSYLTQKSDLDDRAIHLLFSANRWERARSIRDDLLSGTTLVCDRYAFSGIAFSSAKGLDYSWCRQPDLGLPSPDLVLFLDLSASQAESRGGYGAERYESRKMQEDVRRLFVGTIKEDVEQGGWAEWRVLDAGRTLEKVEEEVRKIALETLDKVEGPIQELWKPSSDF